MCSCLKGKDRLLNSAICYQQERLMLMARQATQGIHWVSTGQFVALQRRV